MSTQLLDNPVHERIDLNDIKQKKINIAVFGHGNVGSRLIDQILSGKDEIAKRRNLNLNIFAVANSTSLLLDKRGVRVDWRETKQGLGYPFQPDDVIEFAKKMIYKI